MNKKRVILSLSIIVAVAAVVVGATGAWFSDTETTVGNTFTSATLDLTVDGGNVNVVAFNNYSVKPGSQPKHKFTLNNTGGLAGYLDIENIVVSSDEHICLDPETDAGDATCGNPGLGKGELADVINLRLYIDYGCDGSYSSGDVYFYNGLASGVAGNYELDEPLAAGGQVCIVALLDWWSTPDDSKAMTDTMNLDMEFELAQTTGQ
jgi:predicted ribosomally synthesized peptide with SipW-like signal peptide